jgi:hypothetical protein
MVELPVTKKHVEYSIYAFIIMSMELFGWLTVFTGVSSTNIHVLVVGILILFFRALFTMVIFGMDYTYDSETTIRYKRILVRYTNYPWMKLYELNPLTFRKEK